MRDVLLFSGGLDSLIAYFYLEKPLCLFVNMHQKYAKIELECVKKMQQEIGMDLIIDDTTFDFHEVEQDDLTIPNRNAYLAMLASNYGDNIWMAAVDGDYNHDKTPEIFDAMSMFLSKLKGKSIQVKSPFWNMTKTEMIEWYINQGYNIEWLKMSYSCFSGNKYPCGRCSSCLRRWVGMYNNGIIEDYEEDPITWERIPEYIERMQSGTGKHDSIGRRKEFLLAMKKANKV